MVLVEKLKFLREENNTIFIMKIAIKYPRKKFIEVSSLTELERELNVLMITKFDIKNSVNKPFTNIKLDIDTNNITVNDFSILQKENAVIVPTNISQCKV